MAWSPPTFDPRARLSAPGGERRDFASEQDGNRRALRAFLAGYFALALLGGWIAGRALEHAVDPAAWVARIEEPGVAPRPIWADRSVHMALAVGLAAVAWWRRLLREASELPAARLRARPVADRAVLNVVEEQSIAAAVPPPRALVVEDDAPNAFAWGTRPEATALVLTSGLIARLSRDELSAVVAHELGHVRSGDTRRTTLVLGLAGAFSLVATLALGPLKAIFWDAWRASRDDPEEQPPPPAPRGPDLWERTPRRRRPLLLLGMIAATLIGTPIFGVLAVAASLAIALLWVGALHLAPLAAAAWAAYELLVADRRRVPEAPVAEPDERKPLWALGMFVPVGLMVGPAIVVLGLLVPAGLLLLRLAMARNRELDADMAAVEFTRHPAALLTALLTLRDAGGEGARLGAFAPAAIVTGALSSHPPLHARIARVRDLLADGPRIVEARLASGGVRPRDPGGGRESPGGGSGRRGREAGRTGRGRGARIGR